MPDLDALIAIVWTADAVSLRFTYVSGGAEALLGFRPDVWLSRPTFWTDRLHLEDRDVTVARIREAIDRRSDAVLEYRVMTASGEVRWIRDLVSLRVSGVGGHATELCGVMMDISADKTREAQLQATITRLEEQARQVKKMAALGRLTGIIAHDLNNVLCAIQGLTDLAVLAGSPRAAESELQQVQKAADLGATLIRHLLTYSRGDEADTNRVDVNQSLVPMFGILQGLAGDAIRVQLDLTERVCHVRIAHGLIEQVVMNLAVNAGDAMPEGGRLDISTAVVSRPHPASLTMDVPFVLLQVRDTGTGIPNHIRQQIFEPYFTTKAEGRGTGLGLSIVTAIVREAGGHIEVDSHVGLGTTFRVYLPLS